LKPNKSISDYNNFLNKRNDLYRTALEKTYDLPLPINADAIPDDDPDA
jgi:hypothetical protein